MNSKEFLIEMHRDYLTKNEITEYKKLLQKKYRLEKGIYIIEGKHLVEEALKAKVVQTIISTEKIFDFDETFFCHESEIKKLSTTTTPQNIIGICKMTKPKKLGDNILFLNKINDPGNLGTLIRTAKAFGYNDIVIEGVDIYNPKVLRSAQGATFFTNCINITNSIDWVKEQRQKGYWIYGALLRKESKEFDKVEKHQKNIIILGNEATGIEFNIEKLVDEKIYIPIKYESLNIAVAGGIILNNFKKII
ncbi:MAG: TrmH family RNA methyltransferase [Metamycoplasmataceae bacterium]